MERNNKGAETDKNATETVKSSQKLLGTKIYCFISSLKSING